MKTKFLILCTLLLPATLFGQQKTPLDYQTYDIWEHIEASKISDDGLWSSYELNPREGDGTLIFTHTETNVEKAFPRAIETKFSPTNKYAAFKIKPFHDTIQAMKRDDVPEEELPKDSIGMYVFDSHSVHKTARVKSFKMPEEESPWMAYLYEKAAPEAGEDSTKTGDEAKNNKNSGDEDDEKLYQLVITNPLTKDRHEFSRVKEYAVSRNGALFSFITVPEDSLDKAVVHTFETRRQQHDSLPEMEGTIEKITADMQGDYLAFIHSADTIDKKTYALYFWQEGTNEAKVVADTLTEAIPENWTASKHGKIRFSRDNSKLYFGTSLKPEPEPKDTLLESEKVKLDVWHYKDKRLQTQQLEELEEDKKENFLAVFHIDENKVVQLEDQNLPDVELQWHGNTEMALGENDQPYLRRISHEWPKYEDIYTVNINTGKRTPVLKETQNPVSMSPEGKYVLYYNYADSCWYSYATATGKRVNLTGKLDVPFYRVAHDYPNDPYPYGHAGWTEDDRYVLIYDEFDIWKLDPDGEEAPVNLTNGRSRQMEYRYEDLDEERPYIPGKKPMLAKIFNQKTKAAGFCAVDIRKAQKERLIMADAEFSSPKKAKHAEKLLWRKENVDMYPDIWVSNREFEDAEQLSRANPQQEDYIWADVELTNYITADGSMEEALVYKPENFDPEKTYPMMVYFYRLHTDELHNHYTPRASYSIINPLFYASNGYVVLIPNIRYEVGYPGESAFNHVIGATLQMAGKPYIDRQRIGVQGQSWGGYEIAYIVTRTDIFKAASPGAPVSNMTSAYGGIRWGSGLVRQFQYEETQSRIGGSLWEKPLQYIENSPLFWADKIHTPLLIRHDDDDGAVPWYQGIELFNALRRLNKPAWLINYNDAPHNLTKKRANRKDWSKRMKQYFDHYLKDKPAPVWLKKGIPAIKKGDTYGFELTDE